MPINIDFLANVRDFLRGTRDVEDAFDDVADSLDDVARDGDQATERIERSFRELSDVTKREMSDATRSASRDLDRTAQHASETMNEVKSEALQNAAETFSSFDGTATSFIDGIQGTFGGLIAGLAAYNAALIPIAVAGAAAIGAATGALENQEERAQAVRERAAELAQAWVESGAISERSLSDVADRLEEMVTSSETGNRNIADLRDTMREAGLVGEDSFRAVTRALAGDSDQLDALLESYRELRAELAVPQAGASVVTQQQRDQLNNLGEIIGLLEEEQKAQQRLAEIQEAGGLAEVDRLRQQANLIDQVNDAYDDAATSVDDYLDAETGIFDVQRYLDAMQKREQALRDYQTTLAESDLTPEARAFLSEQGADAAAAFLQGYKDATPEQQAELNRIWTEAGKTDSATYSGALEENMPETVTGPRIVPQEPDASAVTASIQRQFSGRVINVRTKLVDQYGRSLDS